VSGELKAVAQRRLQHGRLLLDGEPIEGSGIGGFEFGVNVVAC
jgi:hypothetical protein